MKKIFAFLCFWIISVFYSLFILFCFYKFSFFRNLILAMESFFHSQDLAVCIFVLLFILLPLGCFRIIYNKFS